MSVEVRTSSRPRCILIAAAVLAVGLALIFAVKFARERQSTKVAGPEAVAPTQTSP